MTFQRLLRMAEEEAEAITRDFPGEIRAALARVAIFFEERPTPWRVEEGLEPDLLGLFEGPLPHEEPADQPPRVTLWLGNLWDYTGEEKEYRREVRTTLLHEIGHYLGYDEEELDERGLL